MKALLGNGSINIGCIYYSNITNVSEDLSRFETNILSYV